MASEVVVDMTGQMQLLEGRHDGQKPPQRAQQSSGSNAYADARNGLVQHNAPATDYDQFDDDIPFD